MYSEGTDCKSFNMMLGYRFQNGYKVNPQFYDSQMYSIFVILHKYITCST